MLTYEYIECRQEMFRLAYQMTFTGTSQIRKKDMLQLQIISCYVKRKCNIVMPFTADDTHYSEIHQRY